MHMCTNYTKSLLKRMRKQNDSEWFTIQSIPDRLDPSVTAFFNFPSIRQRGPICISVRGAFALFSLSGSTTFLFETPGQLISLFEGDATRVNEIPLSSLRSTYSVSSSTVSMFSNWELHCEALDWRDWISFWSDRIYMVSEWLKSSWSDRYLCVLLLRLTKLSTCFIEIDENTHIYPVFWEPWLVFLVLVLAFI